MVNPFMKAAAPTSSNPWSASGYCEQIRAQSSAVEQELHRALLGLTDVADALADWQRRFADEFDAIVSTASWVDDPPAGLTHYEGQAVFEALKDVWPEPGVPTREAA